MRRPLRGYGSYEQFRASSYRASRKGAAGVTEKDRDQTPDEVTGETTSAFPSADFVSEPDALPTVGADSAVSGVEALPPGSALIVVKRGPAGSRFLLDQPVTSAATFFSTTSL